MRRHCGSLHCVCSLADCSCSPRLRLRKPLVPAPRLPGFLVLLTMIGPVVGSAGMFMAASHGGVALSSVISTTGPLLVIALPRCFSESESPGESWEPSSLGFTGASLIAVPGATPCVAFFHRTDGSRIDSSWRAAFFMHVRKTIKAGTCHAPN